MGAGRGMGPWWAALDADYGKAVRRETMGAGMAVVAKCLSCSTSDNCT